MNKQILWEAVKEPLRLLVLSVIPVLLAMAGDLPYEWAGIVIVLLRLIDSVLHEIGKARTTKKEESPLLLGLTRF